MVVEVGCGRSRRVLGVRVARWNGFGGPEVLVTAEAPDPVAGAGQVVIAVRAADVLFLETVVRRVLARRVATLHITVDFLPH